MEQTPEQGIGKTAPPLPEPDGDVVRVSTVEQLQAAADDLHSLDPWSLEWEGRSPEYHPAALQPPPTLIEGNLTRISPDWFADFAKGDLHLTERGLEVIDRAVPLGEVRDDFDGRIRPVGPLSDLGACEYPGRKRDG